MKNKKLKLSILSLALVAVVGIGGTLAYLSSKTDPKTNTFTMGKGITGETEEPHWDPKEAEKFTPGQVIAKDPQIHNTSDESTDPVYAAATITYQMKNSEGTYVDCTYADLDKFINIKTGDIEGFSNDWELNDAKTIAYYTKEKVAAKKSTTAIFDKVEIDKLALTPDQVASATGSNPQFDITKYTKEGVDYTIYEMKDFQIVVQGYLVQGSDEFKTCKDAMQTAFPDVFK